MGKTTTIIGGIIALVVIGGIFLYVGQNRTPSSDSTTTTPTQSTDTNQTDTATRQPGAPLVTTNGSVAPSDTTAVVTGVVTPNGASTSYWYEYGVSSDLGSKTSSPSQTIGSGFASIPAPGYITGLAKNTTYYFRLVAENQFSRITGTQYSFQTTEGNPSPAGSAPTIKTLAASGIARTTANLNGEITPNKASTQYWFEYGKTTNLGDTTAIVSVGNGTAKLPASGLLSNIDPATTYYFRLNAQNQFGTVNGTILSFKTAGPASAVAPSVTTRSATDLGTSTAALRGTVNPNSAETVYWFEYSTDPLLSPVSLRSTEQKSAGAGTNTTSVEADISGLGPKTNYYFRLVARNSLGTVQGERMTFKTK